MGNKNLLADGMTQPKCNTPQYTFMTGIRDVLQGLLKHHRSTVLLRSDGQLLARLFLQSFRNDRDLAIADDSEEQFCDFQQSLKCRSKEENIE